MDSQMYKGMFEPTWLWGTFLVVGMIVTATLFIGAFGGLIYLIVRGVMAVMGGA